MRHSREANTIWPIIQDVRAINDPVEIVVNAYIEDADRVVHLRACLLTPVGAPGGRRETATLSD